MKHLDSFVFHQFLKLDKIDLAIAIQVSLLDHGDHLLLTEGLAQVVHGDHQLLLRDQTVTVSVEHPEAVSDVLVNVASLPGHHGYEFVEVDAPVHLLVLLTVLDHGLQFLLGGAETMLSQNLAQLICCDLIPLFVRRPRE